MKIYDWNSVTCDKCFGRGHDPKDCMMKQEDLRRLHKIAAFIGARLHYPCPLVNGQGNPWVSTIKVDQHKEKFFYVRVYCKLAHKDLVTAKWEWMRANEETVARVPKKYFPDGFVSGSEPTQEFVDRCLKGDAIHYRKVYMQMVELQPHLNARICAQADYAELLYRDYEEACQRLDQLTTENLVWVEHLIKQYRTSNLEGLKAYLKVVYEPSWKDFSSVDG